VIRIVKPDAVEFIAEDNSDLLQDIEDHNHVNNDDDDDDGTNIAQAETEEDKSMTTVTDRTDCSNIENREENNSGPRVISGSDVENNEDRNKSSNRSQPVTTDEAVGRDSAAAVDLSKKELCPICGKTFRKLHVHMRRHRHPTRGDSGFECSDCGRTFTRSDGLAEHRRIRHSNDRPFLCVKVHTLLSLFMFPQPAFIIL